MPMRSKPFTTTVVRHGSICCVPLLLAAALVLAARDASTAQFPRGGRGAGGGGSQDRAVVAEFDADKNGRLDAAEREAARQSLSQSGGGRGGGGRGGGIRGIASPGITLRPADVRAYPDAPLYDAATLRTFFLEFESPAWEAELVAFNNTDVDVPATVTVDGRVYHDVGVHFRGNSSFNVGNGYKRSLNLSFDFVHEDQAIGGYRTLNFLNANADPTFMRTVLSMHIARQYIPAPKANFVRVVINGENWGIYANAQQFNKEFVRDNFNTTKGGRWKVPQGGRGGFGVGGFTYVGDDVDRYNGVFQIKSKDRPEDWAALIDLARTLQETPPEQLEAALASRLDIDGYLRFLALDNALASGDGFYARGADYSLYLDPDGRFHFVFHDANEMFSAGGGRGGPGGGGVRLSPLTAQDDQNKPIISKVLAVPALRAKYLAFVREIAETWLDWNAVGPVVRQYRDLIAADVARDTRKLYTTEEFLQATSDTGEVGTLRGFIEERRAFLLRWLAENNAGAQPEAVQTR
jgi:hypothetical protein